MDLNGFFLLLEENVLSVWLRESTSMFVFPGILSLHAIGMAFLVGTNVALDLRVLGFAPRVPVSTMEKFFPVMRFGFWVNAVSGVLLLIAYPTKGLTNPVFYLKLTLIALALAATRVIRNSVVREPRSDERNASMNGKILAGVSIVLWVGAVTAGRLLAYTCVWLSATDKC